MSRPLRDTLLGAGLLAVASGALADDLSLENPWLRAVPPATDAMAGYFELRNQGNRSVRLDGAEARFARAADLRQSRTGEDGRRLEVTLDTVRVDPGDRVRFRPGGRFLRLNGLSDVPRAGEQVEVCLTFTNHDDVCADFQVRNNPPL